MLVDELDDLLYEEVEDNEELDVEFDSSVYFGIIVDEKEKEINEIYAGTEIYLDFEKHILKKVKIDITGDELDTLESEFKSVSEIVD